MMIKPFFSDESAFPKRISQIGSAASEDDLETVAQIKTEVCNLFQKEKINFK